MTSARRLWRRRKRPKKKDRGYSLDSETMSCMRKAIPWWALLLSLCGPLCLGQNSLEFDLIDHRSEETAKLMGLSVGGVPFLPVEKVLNAAQVPFSLASSGAELKVGSPGEEVGVFLLGVENCIIDGRLSRCTPSPRLLDDGFVLPSSMVVSLLDAAGAVPGRWTGDAFHLGKRVPDQDTKRPTPTSNKLEEKLIVESTSQDAPYQLKVVVIDPGHGGKDPGCISPSGLKESAVTLDVGLRLKTLLEEDKQLGLDKVVLTRDRDVSVPLLDRGKIANAAKGDLFISLHTNASMSRYASGIETYFVSQTDDASSLEVESRENAVMDLDIDGGGLQAGEGVSLEAILLDLQYMEFVRESQGMGVILQRGLCETTGSRDRGVRQALFYVLRGASMPSVLVELGFMTNPAEEKRLSSPTYRQKLAAGIARSVAQYAHKLEAELRPGTGQSDF